MSIEPFVEPLTRREREILHLLADGQSNREIAERLSLALSSVKWYLQQIYGKLGVNNRRQAVSRAKALGMFDNDLHNTKPLHNLPVRLTSLVGREKEIRALEKMLLKPEIHLISLIGPGGIGKTRLAIQASESVLPAFAHGVWFVSLDSLQSHELLAEAICTVIDLPFTEQVSPAEQLLESIRNKEMLFVLDSYEHLLPEGTKLLIDILQKAPGVKVVVTSRERLNLLAERAFEVFGLDFPRNGLGSGFETSPAVKLFLQRARQSSDFVLTDEERMFAMRIAQLVEGIPLALELAAAWVPALSLREIADEIERGLGFLQARQNDLPQRHRSMQVVYEHSWRLLTDDERAVFRRLSVFRGGFNREAASIVAGASSALLASLVDKSLLQHSQDGRYHVHDLLRQFASDELEKARENDAIRERHLTYFLEMAKLAEPELWREQQQHWLARLDREHANLQAALAWCLSPRRKTGVYAGLSLVCALEPFWQIRGRLTEAVGWLAALLTHPSANEDRITYANSLRFAGKLTEFGLGTFEDARWQFQQSLDIVEAEGTSLILAHILCDYGYFCRAEGNSSDAESFLQRSLLLYRELGYEPGIARALRRLGQVAFGKDGIFDYPLARSYYKDSAQVWKSLGNKSELAQTLLELGRSYTYTGEYAEARVAINESLAMSRELHDLCNVARGLNFSGWLAFSVREIDLARTYLEESLEIYRDLGMKSYTATTLFNLGEIARYQGDYFQALIFMDAALVLAGEMGYKQGQIWALLSKGLVLLRLQDGTGAGKLLKEGLLLCREINSIFDSAIALIGLAGVSVVSGEAESAARLLGIAQVMIDSTPIAIERNPADLIEYEYICDQVRGQLDEFAFNRELQMGREMAAEGLDATIEYFGYDGKSQ